MTFDIHVATQDHENYSDVPNRPYWKAKGGRTIVLTGFVVPANRSIEAAATAVVESHRATIEVRNDYYQSDIIGWGLHPAGQATHDEMQQQEYDGRVSYPSERRVAA